MLDCSKMKWDIQNTPTDRLFTTYPDLYQLYRDVFLLCDKPVEPHENLSKEQIISLVVYTYHLKSPLVQQEASIHKRRLRALGLLGIEVAKPETSVYLKYILGDCLFLNRLALEMCKLENNFKWVELCRKSEMLDDIFLTLKMDMAGVSRKSASDIMKIKLEIEEQAEGIQNRVQQLALEIFKDDGNLLNIAASHGILEKRKRVLTPEDVAGLSKQELQSAFAE